MESAVNTVLVPLTDQTRRSTPVVRTRKRHDRWLPIVLNFPMRVLTAAGVQSVSAASTRTSRSPTMSSGVLSAVRARPGVVPFSERKVSSTSGMQPGHPSPSTDTWNVRMRGS